MDKLNLKLFCSCALLTLTASSCQKVQQRPNVILILTDDQGYGEVAACGNPIIKTPAMDELHNQGVHLEDFHTNPFSAPSRAAIMTGRYSQRVGVWDTQAGNDFLDKEEQTMGQLFQEGGYKTAIFGKWHLGDPCPYGPEFRGFDESVVHAAGAMGQVPDYWNNDNFDDTYRHNGKYEKYKGYCTDVFFDEAIKFIKKNQNNPFFCFISANAPHGPYHVPDKYTNMYKDSVNIGLAKVYGMITNVDDNITKLRKQLKELKLDKNTIVIFMTDNGASGWKKGKGWYNAGMRGGKGSVYEGGHRVPCFLYWPEGGWTGGKAINDLTAHIDLLPTFIEACNLPAPKNKLDGTSLCKLLNGEINTLPDRTLFTDQLQGVRIPIKYRNMVAMNGKWRLVNRKQLYNITTDPSQKKNVADDHPDIVKELNLRYEKWLEDVSDGYKYREITIGADNVDEVLLSSESWRGTKKYLAPLNNGCVRKGQIDNGYILLNVDKDGVYEFQLARWPKETNTSILDAVKAGPIVDGMETPGGARNYEGTKLNIKTARLQVADFDETKEVHLNEQTVNFKVALKKGSTRMQTWFATDKNKTLGAYYVYVKKVD